MGKISITRRLWQVVHEFKHGVHNKTLSLKYMFVCMPRYEKLLDSFLSASEVSSTLSFPTLGSRKLLAGCWATVTNACLP